MDSETFNCPNCRSEIPVADIRSTAAVVCAECGNEYRLEFDDFDEAYRLIPPEPPQYPTDIDTDRI
jgi:DNA-directed RNA polymerase subunit RPC12/RpoP